MLFTIPFYLFFVPLTIFFAIIVIIASFFDRSGDLSNRISIVWGGLVCRLAGIKVHVDRGDFDPDEKYILMINHQSWFDIPVLLVALKGHQFRFVAKQSLFRIPFFGQAMSRIGYIGIDRDNPRRGIKSIQEAIVKSEHASILIFPEGSRFEKLGDFKIGPMILAIKSGRPVVPVLIAGTHAVIPKNSWCIRPGSVAVRFFPAHDIQDAYTLKERERLKNDMWKIMSAHSKETEEWLDKKRP